MSVKANNIYVGARYIPRIMGEYSNETAYEALDIVTSGGVGYISRQPVPAGTAVTNKEYWAMWGSGNAAIDGLTQRVTTTEENIEGLQTSLNQTNENLTSVSNTIPWKVSSILKGDGTTDNTSLFGTLDANTPIALLPGTYLITGNVTIPCPIQFLPGAVLKYNAATVGVNYATVTFNKGFAVPDNTQIFDTYIIPKIGTNNNAISPHFSWYGGKEGNSATVNDNILAWLCSYLFVGDTNKINQQPANIIFDAGTYTFNTMGSSTTFQNNSRPAMFEGNGATIMGGTNNYVTLIGGTYKGFTFGTQIRTDPTTSDKHPVVIDGCAINIVPNGGINTYNIVFNDVDFSRFANGPRTSNATYNRCVFEQGAAPQNDSGYNVFNNCSFVNTSSDNTICGIITASNYYGTMVYNDCTINGSNSTGSIISCEEDTNTLRINFNGCTFNGTNLGFPKQANVNGCNLAYTTTIRGGRFTGCTLGGNIAEGTDGGNYINGVWSGNKQIIGYTLTSDNTSAVLSPGSNVVNFELVELYSDGTYKNMGAIPNPGVVSVIGMHKNVTYNNVGKSILIAEDEDAKQGIVIYRTSNSTDGTKGAFAIWQFTVSAAQG